MSVLPFIITLTAVVTIGLIAAIGIIRQRNSRTAADFIGELDRNFDDAEDHR